MKIRKKIKTKLTRKEEFEKLLMAGCTINMSRWNFVIKENIYNNKFKKLNRFNIYIYPKYKNVVLIVNADTYSKEDREQIKKIFNNTVNWVIDILSGKT
jgi:hypothetical protein